MSISLNDYASLFPGHLYLDRFYAESLPGSNNEPDYHELLDNMVNADIKEVPAGKRFLDVGCGPSIRNAIPASRHFDEIVMADGIKANLDEINKWVSKASYYFYWRYTIKKYAAKQEPGASVAEVEQRVRSKIKSMITCDINNSENIFGNDCVGQFDLVVSTLTVESAVADRSQLNQAVANIAKTVTPGGHLIIGAAIDTNFFYVNGDKLPIFNIKCADVEEAIKNAGLAKVKADYQPYRNVPPYLADEVGGLLAILARK